MCIRFLFNIGECIYLVFFWGYKNYIPYFIYIYIYINTHTHPCRDCIGYLIPSCHTKNQPVLRLTDAVHGVSEIRVCLVGGGGVD